MFYKRRENTAFKNPILFSIFPLLFITLSLTAQVAKTDSIKSTLTKPLTGDISDTTRKKAGDSTFQKTDTLDIKISRDSLDAPVRYEAADSGVLEIDARKFYLYGKASTKYLTLDLQASIIEIDNEKSVAKAFYSVDTAGKVIDRPKLIDGEMESESDSLFYNFKTQKGLSKSTYTKQGEMFVYAERIKKYNATEFFASKGRFTTCNLDTPHFAFRAQRLKLVNNKWAYSGLAYPEFEAVPMPLGIPFGIYPLSQGKHSGLLPPSFVATQSFGLGLEGLGYYKVLNEYFDIIFRTNIYSYGGYTLNFSPTYRKRYKYSGGARLDFQNTKVNFKGDPDYSNTKTFNVSWFHTMDGKARPGTNFSANINFGSTQFNRLVPNNSMLNFTNQIASSINYSKTWDDGKYNMSVTGNHSQNNQTGLYNVSLPNLTFTMNTIYPLQKKENIGAPKWYEKLGIGLNSQIQNQFSFYDSDSPYIKYNIGEIIDTMQWGAQHTIPISLALPSLGPFQVSPSISYQERWYGQQVIRQWNPTTEKVDTLVNKGFYRGQEMTFGLGFQTAIFGTFNFKKKPTGVQAIRHVIRPNMGLSYKPDLASQDYYEFQIDTLGNTLRTSKYQGSIIPGFAEGRFGGITFGIQNNIEMKVRNKKDTSGSEPPKKIMLIDNFSLNSAYNLIADSFQLSPISVLISTNLFEKFSITGTTSIDPYQVNEVGRRINKYVWEGGKFKLGRITTGSLSFSTRFESKKKDEDKKQGSEASERQQFITPEEEQRQMEYIRNNPAEFADFNVPWSVDIAYAFNFSQLPLPDYSGFNIQTFQSINLRGDFNFSPKWKLGGNMFYDITTGNLANLNMFITRDMHCWQMSINITPVGLYPSFNISLFPKSGILRDLKVNRTRFFYQ
jgi:hypothetical protein